MTINQQLLNTYFSTAWRERNRTFGNYQFTGYSLTEQVQEGEKVIDVGCGINPFKGVIPNLIGIDPAFPEADFQLSLEDFVKRGVLQRFNVAFCLGSINFGTQEDIEYQIGLLTKVLRTKGARIYWRCNPGLKDHGNNECEQIPFYDWSFEEHLRLAPLFGFKVETMEWDSNNRIYAEWIQLTA
jgi:hypothetical protein